MKILTGVEVPKRPSNLPTGPRTPKYDEVIQLANVLEIEQALELEPAEFDVDPLIENALNKFRTNIASTIRRHVTEPAHEAFEKEPESSETFLKRFMTYMHEGNVIIKRLTDYTVEEASEAAEGVVEAGEPQTV